MRSGSQTNLSRAVVWKSTDSGPQAFRRTSHVEPIEEGAATAGRSGPGPGLTRRFSRTILAGRVSRTDRVSLSGPSGLKFFVALAICRTCRFPGTGVLPARGGDAHNV